MRCCLPRINAHRRHALRDTARNTFRNIAHHRQQQGKTMNESDFRNTWDTYTASWKADSEEARLAAYATCLDSDCTYTDPNVEAAGYAEIAAYMAGFQQQMPGGGFVTRNFSAHHTSALVHWDMTDGEGNVVSPGTSIGVFGTDGRLVSMTGFF